MAIRLSGDGRAHRPSRHTDSQIAWSLCDGCPSMEVLDPDPRLRTGKVRYRCNALHKNLSRKEVYEMNYAKCPRDFDVDKRRLT